MGRPDSERHGHRADPLRLLCKIAGVPDLETYLGIQPGASSKDVLVKLERKRRDLEAALDDPRRAHEAELFLDSYDDIRTQVTASVAKRPRFGADTPDYYEVLEVQPTASYAAIERAWRSLQAHGRDHEPVVAQAWRVLGDPLNRANYDRSRRETLDRPTPEPPPRHRTDPAGSEASEPRGELLGPSVRDVRVEDDEVAVCTLPLMVRGRGRWRATITTDHPALSTRPARVVSVSPGQHTIAVYVDPDKLERSLVTCSLTVGNAHEQHVVAFRVRRRRPGRWRRIEPFLLVAGAVALVTAGFVVGTNTTFTSAERQPASVGHIYQLPRVQPCFEASYGPLPSWLDVHTDGLGRPTGFRFGGIASKETEACVRKTLVSLEFPPTRDGLPAFHRYRIGPTPSSPDVIELSSPEALP